ncbi:hypothetical protein DH2020_044698 [Rehmannia glutinosa]|uniref:Uncharacterized protein n=1 Tax=Rehmannia glutinosa TaxID=99300 RepID=A0ABR0UHY3_REHGL
MGCFKIPKTLIHDIESLLSSYWWGNQGQDKVHWVRWDKLCNNKREGELGFRDLHALNMAMLAKQEWRIITQPNSLLSRLMNARYFPNISFQLATTDTKCSNTWRSILAARYTLISGMRWQIGNEEFVHIWSDSWIPRDGNFKAFRGMRGSQASTTMVSLLYPVSKWWNEEQVREAFYDKDVEFILGIPVAQTDKHDQLIWNFSKSADRLAKSGLVD